MDELKQEVHSGDLPDARRSPKRSALKPWLAVASVITSVVVLAGIAALVLRQPVETVPQLVNPVQVTSQVGVEDYPTWSPDGRALAYETGQGLGAGSGLDDADFGRSNWDIWVTEIGTGDTVNRTRDHAGADRFPAWSPDGSQLAFFSDRDGGGYYVMSAFGGTPRRVMPAGDLAVSGSRPQWSPDGGELAVVMRDGTNRVAAIVSLLTGSSRTVPLPARPASPRFDLSWSPDGRFFSYVDGHRAFTATQLWVTSAVDGSGHPVSDGATNDWSPIWSPDGRTLFYVSDRVEESENLTIASSTSSS